MIGHYLAMALAKFRKAPFTTFANIVTLAMGLACFIAAWGIATWWQSADGYHSRADRTVMASALFRPVNGEKTPISMRTPVAVASMLRQSFPEVETVARVFAQED